jgi:hypothetical protein
MRKKIILFYILLTLVATNIFGQRYQQLEIVEDSVSSFLSSHEMLLLDAFGRFKYALYTSKDIGKAEIINTETGRVSILQLDYKNYSPVSFINNDTILLRSKKGNNYLGYKVSTRQLCSVNSDITNVLQAMPANFSDYRYKVNKQHSKLAVLKRDQIDNNFSIFFLEKNRITERKLATQRYFKTWHPADFFWLDDNYLLISVVKAEQNGSFKYEEKIYDFKNDIIANIKLPANSFQIDDVNDGNCIVETVNGNPQFIIYKVKIEKGQLIFFPTHYITANTKSGTQEAHIGFLSNNKIAQTTNIEGEKGTLQLSLSLKKYSSFKKLFVTDAKK